MEESLVDPGLSDKGVGPLGDEPPRALFAQAAGGPGNIRADGQIAVFHDKKVRVDSAQSEGRHRGID